MAQGTSGSLEIIAEAAQGYLGDDPASKCQYLARLAAAAGADAIKYQLVFADELCSPDYYHYEQYRHLELPESTWSIIADAAAKLGIGIYFDVFGAQSLRIAEGVDCAGIKIHGTDLLNLTLLREVARSGVGRVILGIGGSYGSEISDAVEILGNKEIVLMHGFQSLPTPHAANQIARLVSLASVYPDALLGFADHVEAEDLTRLWFPAIAVGAGAVVIEKHLTTALCLDEEDAEAALAPDDFAIFVSNIRVAFSAFGSASKAEDFGMSREEESYRKKTKKHILLLRDLKRGEAIAEADISMKRTSTSGDVLFDPKEVIGRTVTRDLKRDAVVRRDDVR